jgi:hypothetical protein
MRGPEANQPELFCRFLQMAAPEMQLGQHSRPRARPLGVQLVPCRSQWFRNAFRVCNVHGGQHRTRSLPASVGDVQKLSRNADGAVFFADIQFRVPYGNRNQLVMLDQWNIFRRQPSLPQSQTPAAGSCAADELQILHRIIML